MPSCHPSVSNSAISKNLSELPPSFMVLNMLKPADRLSYLDKMFQPTVAIQNTTTNGSYSTAWAPRNLFTGPISAGGINSIHNMVMNSTNSLKH